MLIKTFAIFAVFSGTALPLSFLCVHAYVESQIPHCDTQRSITEPVCADVVTGLKYDSQFRRPETDPQSETLS